MIDENKVEETKIPEQIGASAPEPQKTEETKTIGEPVISERDKLRMDVEEKIVGEPAPLPPETTVTVQEVEAKPKETENEDATERLKAKIEKRIGKEVAKRKTLEEQLAEKDAEIERLKSGVQVEKKPEKEPTLQEIAAALKKARDDGDTQFEVEILDYMAERKAKKERKEAEESYTKTQTQATERQRKWGEIVQDYTVTDDSGAEVKDHPLNLANPQSQLYKTANALYLDPELKKHRYSSGTEMENLRRAISDAYVELTKMGVSKKETTHEVNNDGKTPKERLKTSLVEPSAAKEESQPKAPAKPKNDQDKVLDEVKHRVMWKRDRETALI